MPVTGKRVLGHRLKRQRWFECAVSGLEGPEEEFIFPEDPHPQMGLAVHRLFYDEPTDVDTLRLLNGPVEVGDDNEGNYE